MPIRDRTLIINSAKRAVATEKQALFALERAIAGVLGENFFQAVKLIASMSGRVIVTGVGKSGHIGSKIAATFSSTGTPAVFIHAAEANHGDLGAIETGDVLLALSKSGESTELRNTLSYARRFEIPVISITSNPQSWLAAGSDVALVLPDGPEVCPHGLAATTSALLQLALGDMLAVALLEAHDFSSDDFRVFHPGGKLGAALARVGDIMYRNAVLPLVVIGTGCAEAIDVLSRMHFGCVGVVNHDGQLRGIVTQGDIARNLQQNLQALLVDDVMSKQPKVVSSDSLVSEAIALLERYRIGVLFVVNETDMPVGLVRFHDLMTGSLS